MPNQLDLGGIAGEAKLRRKMTMRRRPRTTQRSSNPIQKKRDMRVSVGACGNSLMKENTSNENKMSDGGRNRASIGVGVWKSSQKWSVQRSGRSLHRPVRFFAFATLITK